MGLLRWKAWSPMKAIRTSPAFRRTVYPGSSRLPTISGWRRHKVHCGSSQRIMPPMNAETVDRRSSVFRFVRYSAFPRGVFDSGPSRDRAEAAHRTRIADSGRRVVHPKVVFRLRPDHDDYTPKVAQCLPILDGLKRIVPGSRAIRKLGCSASSWRETPKTLI